MAGIPYETVEHADVQMVMGFQDSCNTCCARPVSGSSVADLVSLNSALFDPEQLGGLVLLPRLLLFGCVPGVHQALPDLLQALILLPASQVETGSLSS